MKQGAARKLKTSRDLFGDHTSAHVQDRFVLRLFPLGALLKLRKLKFAMDEMRCFVQCVCFVFFSLLQ